MKRTMMKGATVATLALVAAFAAADPVQVTVNGSPVNFEGAQPEMIDGHVFVPLRGVFEQMGANVDWDPASQSVMADGAGRHVRLKIGSLDANVNGKIVTMDVAPQITQDSTMVPLRFLSESLGAKVDWQPENDLVAITSPRPDEGRAQQITPPPPPVIITPPPPPPQTIIIREPAKPERPVLPPPPSPAPPLVITRDTVIPLRLDQKLTSDDSKVGDRVTATVTWQGDRYLDLPEGTMLEGHIRQAKPASGSHGGVLDVRFTRILFPDGSSYRIGGIVTNLDNKDIVQTNRGRFVAKGHADEYIARDAAIGAGAGLVIGSLNGKPVGGSILGGSIGAIVGAFDHHMAHNVIFDQGMKLALILDRDLTIEHRDLDHHR
ncbi:MAG TPA: stalk domain-containing protein [Fimbriimonas sp.]|nr:stalk domain-containing protein [Fimbriimonas sp.]